MSAIRARRVPRRFSESRQTEIAKVIIEQGADYVLALKGNQGDLHTDVVQLFTAARKQNFKNIEHQFQSARVQGTWAD